MPPEITDQNLSAAFAANSARLCHKEIEMDLNNLIQEAGGGNTEAMKDLGEYFLKQRKAGDAAEWFLAAAKAGDPEAAKRAIPLYEFLANSCEQAGELWQSVDYWKKYRECQLLILQMGHFTAESCSQVMAKIKGSLYFQGEACYHMKRYDLAAGYLEEAARDNDYTSGDPRAKALLNKIEDKFK